MKIQETASSLEFEDKIDALSRTMLWTLGHGNSGEIARLGNVSFNEDSGRAIDPQGGRAISVSEKGVYLQEIDCQNLQATTGFSTIPRLTILSPEQIVNQLLHNGMDEQNMYDYRQMAKMLGLLDKDYDKLSSRDGPVVRVVDDQQILRSFPELSENLLPIFDSHQQLLEVDIIISGIVFTAKIFKFVSVPGLILLPFRRETPGVCFIHDRKNPCILDTDINTVLSNAEMSWLNDSGDLEKMDWEVLRGLTPSIVWHAKHDDFQANNYLKHIMNIVAAAKANNLSLDVIKATCVNGQGEEASETERLNITKLCTEALRRGLELPESLRESKYLISLDLNSVIDKSYLPSYWKNGAIAGFYLTEEVKSDEVIKSILQKTTRHIQTLLLIPKDKTNKVAYAVKEFHNDIICADIKVLDDLQELKKITKDKSIHLIIAMCDEDNKNQLIQEKAIEASRELLLPIGIILPSAPHDESAMLYDSMTAVIHDSSSNTLKFIDKPEKAKTPLEVSEDTAYLFM